MEGEKENNKNNISLKLWRQKCQHQNDKKKKINNLPASFLKTDNLLVKRIYFFDN